MGRPSRASRAGFTLLELMIAVCLVLLVSGGVTNLMQGGAGAFRESARTLELGSRATRTLERVVRELGSTGGADVTAQLPEGVVRTTLDYRPCLGREAGVRQWGDPRRLELRLVGGELANGVDDNGNGSVDEWELVLTDRLGAPEEVSVVLGRGISDLAEGELANGLDDDGDGLEDEPGFSLVRTGDMVVVRLTVERVEEGRLVQESVERTVYLRN